MSMDEAKTGRRIDEVESRLAFQDDLIEKLNEVITRQDRELLQLTQRLNELEAKLNDIAKTAALPQAMPGEEVPPHY